MRIGFSLVYICSTALLTGTELSVMSTREREKGNEAYRAGDYSEALQLYSTSIAMDGDFNAYNNRAMTREFTKRCTLCIIDNWRYRNYVPSSFSLTFLTRINKVLVPVSQHGIRSKTAQTNVGISLYVLNHL